MLGPQVPKLSAGQTAGAGWGDPKSGCVGELRLAVSPHKEHGLRYGTCQGSFPSKPVGTVTSFTRRPQGPVSSVGWLGPAMGSRTVLSRRPADLPLLTRAHSAQSSATGGRRLWLRTQTSRTCHPPPWKHHTRQQRTESEARSPGHSLGGVTVTHTPVFLPPRALDHQAKAGAGARRGDKGPGA